MPAGPSLSFDSPSSADHSLGGTAYIYANASWTSATLRDAVCAFVPEHVESDLTTLMVHLGYAVPYAADVFAPLQMPDCFWKLTKLETIILYNVILTGSNVSGEAADPLIRLPPTLKRLQLFNGRLVNPKVSGSTFKPNWNAFFASKPDLESLELRGALIEAALPSFVPPKLELRLPNNLLTGTIPFDLFSNYDSDTSIVFSVPGNKLSGTIPSTLFKNAKGNSIEFDVSNNALTGPLPSFANTSWPKVTGSSVTFNLANNRLYGTIPADLFGNSVWGAAIASINVNDNLLTGTIPETLFSTATSAQVSILDLSLAGNALNGSIPKIFAGVGSSLQIGTFRLDLSRNQLEGSLEGYAWPPASLRVVDYAASYDSNFLSGTLPPSLFTSVCSDMVYISLSLSGNAFNGSVELSMIENASSGIQALRLSLANNDLTIALTPELIGTGTRFSSSFGLDLSSNTIGGTIPNNLFSAYSSPSAASLPDLSLSISNCSLTGTLPSLSTNLESLSFSADDNALTDIPSSSWSGFLSNVLSRTSLQLSVANNAFTGELFLPNIQSDIWDPHRLNLNVHGNNFTNLLIGVNFGYLRVLDVGMNSQLTGTLPKRFFDGTTDLRALVADHTSLSGEFPNLSGVHGSRLEVLDLIATDIDFCSSLWTSPWTGYIRSCSLNDTNAVNCLQNYPFDCQLSFNRTQLTPGTPSSNPSSTPSSGSPSDSPSSVPGAPSTPLFDTPNVPSSAHAAHGSVIGTQLYVFTLILASLLCLAF